MIAKCIFVTAGPCPLMGTRCQWNTGRTIWRDSSASLKGRSRSYPRAAQPACFRNLPVNADIGVIDVSAINISNSKLHSMGTRGIGEIVITGNGPAVVDAIYHAAGKRIRELPVNPDKLLQMRSGKAASRHRRLPLLSMNIQRGTRQSSGHGVGLQKKFRGCSSLFIWIADRGHSRLTVARKAVA